MYEKYWYSHRVQNRNFTYLLTQPWNYFSTAKPVFPFPQKILIVFSVVGGLLCIVELLGVVLSCCMASQHAHVEREAEDWEYEYGNGNPHDDGSPVMAHRKRAQQQQQQGSRGGGSRPVTPQTLMSNDLSSHHETAF